MADCLLAERWYRLNRMVSEHKRLIDPKLGHYDTWLVDNLQRVEQNHTVDYYPNTTNAGDFMSTSEKSGTIRIHSDDLDAALSGIAITPQAKAKSTSEQHFLCKSMGTAAPLLEVHALRQAAAGAELGPELGNDGRGLVPARGRRQGLPQAARLPPHAPQGLDAQPARERGRAGVAVLNLAGAAPFPAAVWARQRQARAAVCPCPLSPVRSGSPPSTRSCPRCASMWRTTPLSWWWA